MNISTLSSITEIIYAARDRVAREMVGFIPGTLINAGSEGVSLGGTVTSIRAGEPTLNTTHTPSMTIPEGDNVTPTTDTMSIGQVANVQIPLTGEAWLKLGNTGTASKTIQDTLEQAMRKIVNAIEAHVGTVLKDGSSRAVGTAGTAPFASDHKIINSLRQILEDNGTPFDGNLSLVINSAAGVNLRNLSNLFKVNEAGTSDTLRRGALLEISDFVIRQSAGVASHTKGTLGGSPTSAAAGFALGATSITLTPSVGTGTIVAGDVLSLATDTANAYVVKTGVADASTAATLVLNQPGLRKATGASTRALSLAANYAGNIGFHRSAVELVMRPPAMPPGGDAASDRMTIFDDKSGLVFEVALYKGYGKNMMDITCYYQAKVWKPEFVATLMG